MIDANTINANEIDAAANAIKSLVPSPDANLKAKFSVLHPLIEQALARGITQRAIMETLKGHGIKLHPAKFKKLIEEARAGLKLSSDAPAPAPTWGDRANVKAE